VNPAQLFPGGAAPDSLLRYQSTSPFPGLLGQYYPYHSKPSGLSTPWVSMPEQYSGTCERANGATWLQLTDIGPSGDSREVIEETLGPSWGTHLHDVNVALGNLVGLTGLQAAAYNIPVVTELASSITQTTATLNATVNPNGAEVTECKFEYGLTSAYGSTAPCAHLPGSGSSAVAVSAAVTGLVANTTYHFRISATNPTGTSNGRDETLTTEPNLSATAPKVETKAALPIAQTTATLNAIVNPNGSEVTECKFEYGTTNSYGSSAPCLTLPGSGSSPVAVTALLTGLIQHTTYHFRISATNPGGVGKGADATFKTLAAGGGHWYMDDVALPASEAEGTYVVNWGTLTLKGEAGAGKGESVTCRTASGGRIWNPAGGGAGRGDTEALALFGCESVGICKAGEQVTITPAALPWASELQATGTTGVPFRLASTGVHLLVSCNGVASAHIEGATEPLAPASEHKGTSAVHPGYLEFDAGSGEQQMVEAFAGPEVGTYKTAGSVKTIGYEGQNLIQAK
jgi:hypothetical protein